ncbi:MAG: ThiF family adenylyltransferase [Solirubrobacteraceae bacterium]|jgi:adenylyltransferase/sulfurtransferase
MTDHFSREQLAGYQPAVLERATIFVVGAGALAQNLLINLALSGVGELRIVDFDEFENHNAPRSPLYPTADEQSRWGMAKARVVAHKVWMLMKAARPKALYAIAPIQALGAGAFNGVDVVVSCVDNAEARAYLSDMCRWRGITLIEGGFDGPSITLSCFPATPVDQAREAPCYRCGNPTIEGSFSCQRHATMAEAAGIIPAIQAAAATLGGLQAESAIQALHGEHPTAFKRTSLNIRTGQLSQYELTTDPNCHGIHERVDAAPRDLDITTADSLDQLVRTIGASFEPNCTIKLPDRLIYDAFCHGCGRVVLVRAPDWAWRHSPICRTCGGAYERLDVRQDHTPTIIGALCADHPDAIPSMSCREAGLPALSLIAAHSYDAERRRTYRLAGQLDDLFEAITP